MLTYVCALSSHGGGVLIARVPYLHIGVATFTLSLFAVTADVTLHHVMSGFVMLCPAKSRYAMKHFTPQRKGLAARFTTFDLQSTPLWNLHLMNSCLSCLIQVSMHWCSFVQKKTSVGNNSYLDSLKKKKNCRCLLTYLVRMSEYIFTNTAWIDIDMQYDTVLKLIVSWN